MALGAAHQDGLAQQQLAGAQGRAMENQTRGAIRGLPSYLQVGSDSGRHPDASRRKVSREGLMQEL